MAAKKRTPKGKKLTAIDLKIVDMGTAVQDYLVAIRELVQMLQQGKGDQHSGELTPRQFHVIEGIASKFGLATMAVLAADSTITAAREGYLADDDAPQQITH